MFNLADPFPAHLQAGANFAKGSRRVSSEAKAHQDHPLFLRWERCHESEELIAQVTIDRLDLRCDLIRVEQYLVKRTCVRAP